MKWKPNPWDLTGREQRYFTRKRIQKIMQRERMWYRQFVRALMRGLP